MTGDQRFHAVLGEAGAMHDRKQRDYGTQVDPFANVRSSEDFGISGWKGALVRANDKMKRLQKFARDGVLANEGVEDSLMDLAVYALIGLVLYREERMGFVPTITAQTYAFTQTPEADTSGQEDLPEDLGELQVTEWIPVPPTPTSRRVPDKPAPEEWPGRR